MVDYGYLKSSTMNIWWSGQSKKLAGLSRWLSGKRICLPMQEVQEMWVPSLGWEDSLEKRMTIHSSILVWRIPWIEEPSGLQSMELQKVRHDWVAEHTHVCILKIVLCIFSGILNSNVSSKKKKRMTLRVLI